MPTLRSRTRRARETSPSPYSPSWEPRPAHFERRIREARVYLEYGAGGSTILAAARGTATVHSVESDAGLLAAVRERMVECYPSTRMHGYHVDIGPTKEWGWPKDASSAAKWPTYCLAPWPTILTDGEEPELILVDGRFRVASFLVSLMLSKPGAVILFDDYFDRPHYHAVEKHLLPTAQFGRMAEFIVPAELDKREAILTLLPFVTNAA